VIAMMHRKFYTRFVVFLIIIFMITFFLGLSNSLKYYRLQTNGIHVFGKIIELNCSHHATFKYQFEADGKNYTGNSTASNAGRICEQMIIGERVDITYLDGNPAVSCVGSSTRMLYGEFFGSILGGCFIIIISSILYYFLTKINKNAFYTHSKN
jgi:hypothetical protein